VRKVKAPKPKQRAPASPRAETAASSAAAAPTSPFSVPAARAARSSSFGGGGDAASVRKSLQTAGLVWTGLFATPTPQLSVVGCRGSFCVVGAGAGAGSGSGAGPSSRSAAEEAEFLLTQPLSG
jgi:hypothetical protein